MIAPNAADENTHQERRESGITYLLSFLYTEFSSDKVNTYLKVLRAFLLFDVKINLNFWTE